MQSDRLPGKVLLPMPLQSQKTMLGTIIDQLSRSRYSGQIIVATAVGIHNDPISHWCNENSISCFRGSESDVLSRFISISKSHGFDVVVRLTADNPLLDISSIDAAIEQHIHGSYDYTYTIGLPVGMNVEVVAADKLISLESMELSEADREHVTHYFKTHAGFNILRLPIVEAEGMSSLRLTVDYPADYLVLSTLLSHTTGLDGIELVKYFNTMYPFVFQANKDMIQKQQFASYEDELGAAISLMDRLEMNRVSLKLSEDRSNRDPE